MKLNLIILGMVVCCSGLSFSYSPVLSLGSASGVGFYHVKGDFVGAVDNAIAVDASAMQWMEKEFKELRPRTAVREAKEFVAKDFLAVIERIGQLPDASAISVWFKRLDDPSKSFVVQIVQRPIEGDQIKIAQRRFQKNVRIFSATPRLPRYVVQFIKTCVLQKLSRLELTAFAVAGCAGAGVAAASVYGLKNYLHQRELAAAEEGRRAQLRRGCCPNQSVETRRRVEDFANSLRAVVNSASCKVAIPRTPSRGDPLPANRDCNDLLIWPASDAGDALEEGLSPIESAVSYLEGRLGKRVFVVGLSQLSLEFEGVSFAELLGGRRGVAEQSIMNDGQTKLIIINDYDTRSGGSAARDVLYAELIKLPYSQERLVTDEEIKSVIGRCSTEELGAARNLLQLRQLLRLCGQNENLDRACEQYNYCFVDLRLPEERGDEEEASAYFRALVRAIQNPELQLNSELSTL